MEQLEPRLLFSAEAAPFLALLDSAKEHKPGELYDSRYSLHPLFASQ